MLPHPLFCFHSQATWKRGRFCSTATLLASRQPLLHRREQQRDVQLVVADDVVAFAPQMRGTTDDVFRGTVMPDHIKGGGGEGIHPIPEIARNGEGFQEHLRHDDSAADVEHHAAFQCGDDRGEPLEIAKARLAQHRAIGSRVLVDYVSSQRDVDSDRQLQFRAGTWGTTLLDHTLSLILYRYGSPFAKGVFIKIRRNDTFIIQS